MRRFYVENFTNYSLEGPTSASGYRVSFHIHDNTPGISTCFLADVVVRDKVGRRIAFWFDHSGQCSAQGVRDLAVSMNWEDGDILAFYTIEGQQYDAPRSKVTLEVGTGGVM
jgi:hypothetical protein